MGNERGIHFMNGQRPCLITGASGNLGGAIARKLVALERSVALTHSPQGRPLEVLKSSEQVRWYGLDVRDAHDVGEVVAQVRKDFGAAPDLVYTAGITCDRSIVRMSTEDWASVIETNLSGAHHFVRALAQDLMTAADGRIIFIGSVAASKGTPGQSNYAAAKAGVEGLTRELAVELGRYQVTVNTVSPGLIESRMIETIPKEQLRRVLKSIPLRSMGKPSDVAEVVSFLLSAAARYITGQIIQVDGGLTAM